MTKRDKKLASWQTLKEERFDSVQAVLTHYGFELLSSSGGSHQVFCHPILKEAYQKDPSALEDFGPDGFLTIPKSHGQTVKGKYLRDALRALEIIEKEEDFS